MDSTGNTPRRRAPRSSGPVTALSTTVDPQQIEADTQEHDLEERYLRYRAFAAVVAEAVRRAEAMTRLENALSLRPH